MRVEPVLFDSRQIEEVLNTVKFSENGLIPAVIQDVANGAVLMVAYMNRESLGRSLQTGRTWFFSRSREQLWLKGETSGNYQYIREVRVDCDADTLLIKVEQTGPACHEGYRSCFYRCLGQPLPEEKQRAIISELYALIKERQRILPEGSYTTKLFQKGIDQIVQKVGEEAVEVVIAGKNRNRAEIIEETSDLIYHLLVLMAECGVTPEDIREKLAERRQ